MSTITIPTLLAVGTVPKSAGDILEQEERPFISRNQTIVGSVAQICRYFSMAVFYSIAIKVIKQKVNTSKSINLVVED